MSLSLALNTALTGLNVNQRSLSALSQNIANANNKEYSRKIVNQEAIYIDGTGAGVRIRDIGRKVNDYLQKAVRDQGSVYGRASVISDYTDRLQSLLGRPGSSNSVYSYMSSFFNTMQSLAQTPENAALRTTAVNSAQTAAREMQTLANGIYDMQYSVDQDIRANIDKVNGNLRDIYALNATIASNRIAGRSVSELEDKRDTLVAEVSEVIDIQTYANSNGVLNIFTAGGFSLVDSNYYQLSYNPAPSADFFANGNATSAINLYRIDESGNRTGQPSVLATSGIGAGVTTVFSSGKIKGLLELRDKQLPDVLGKLDQLASQMRDQLNAVHNSGSAFPGANSYTGTRLMSGEDYSQWSGQVRIAVLDQNGQPIPSNYSNEESGMRPLLIDLSKLDTGNSPGSPSVQGLIDEINRYYGVPQNKVELGNLNDVRLVLNNESIPGTTPQLSFDFKLDNISGQNSDFYVSGLQVLDENGNDITNITQDVPTVQLASSGTYQTTLDSSTVRVTTALPHGYAAGDRIYLDASSGPVNGIPAGSMSGYFTITNVTSTGFDIEVEGIATSTGTVSDGTAGAHAIYATAEPGTNARTTDGGTIIANIAGNTTSRFYTVKATVTTVDEDGTISSATVDYRIDNLQANTKNMQYAATSATGNATVVTPNTVYPAMRAMLVDANGNELPIINNQYTTAQEGYLKLVAGNSTYVIAIDSLDSAEGGQPNSIPTVNATGRSFSHYFELNNFFVENRSTGVTDDVKGSATNMAVNSALLNNVNLISLGQLAQSAAPVDPTKPPLYTYQRSFGDNSVISALADFGTKIVNFAAAGDLGSTSLSLGSYAGQIISTASTKSTSNQLESENAKMLLDGFSENSDAVRGVNLDEELANTIIYQNAYSASARIVTVANEFFDALLDMVR